MCYFICILTAMNISKQEVYFQENNIIAPDEQTQRNLAWMDLQYLIDVKENGDKETKKLIEWELYHRYIPCVHWKDDEIQMSPSRSGTNAWKLTNSIGNCYRSCVTYEDSALSTPQTYIYTDKIANEFNDKIIESAMHAANKNANQNTVRRWEIYLSTLMNKKIQINRIITWIKDNGYPRNAIGRSEVKVSQVNKSKQTLNEVLTTKQ